MKKICETQLCVYLKETEHVVCEIPWDSHGSEED